MKDNTYIFERILQIVDVKGFKNLSELSAFIGYKSPEKLYRLKRNASAKPSLDIIEDFSNKFEDLDLRWFITGKGDGPLLSQGGGASINQLHEPPHKYVSAKRNLHFFPDTSADTLIPLVTATARKEYEQKHEREDFIRLLPSIKIPGLRGGDLRGFEIDEPIKGTVLSRNDVVIGRRVAELGDITGNIHFVVLTRSNGLKIMPAAVIDLQNNIIEIWSIILLITPFLHQPHDTEKRLKDIEADLNEILARLGARES